eukprot:4944254-Alexandrium_andersonii.AAC.1
MKFRRGGSLPQSPVLCATERVSMQRACAEIDEMLCCPGLIIHVVASVAARVSDGGVASARARVRCVWHTN